VAAAHRLRYVWANFEEFGMPYEELEPEDVQNMDFLREHIEIHALPVVVLGSGQSMEHKFHAVMHALKLECNSSHDLSAFTKEVVAFCTDQGTEFGFHKIKRVEVSALFPWLELGAGCHDDYADFAPPIGMHDPPTIDLSACVSIAGLLHIIHNTSNDLGNALHCYDEAVNQAKHVCSLIRQHHTRERLLETCYFTPVGRAMRGSFNGFDAKVHKPRWASIAHAVEQLVRVEHALRWGWNKDRYGQAHRREDAEGKPESLDLAIVDGAIQSSTFWATLRVLHALASVILKCYAWAEGCPCHSHLPREGVPDHILRRWAKCPMRGRRAPCLAAGDFFKCFTEVVAVSGAELVATLPRYSSPEEQGLLLQDFERGRQHMLFAFTLRIVHWRSPPWVLFGCAHGNMDVARFYTWHCLQLVSDHPLVRRLQQEPVLSEAQQFVDGRDLDGLVFFCDFICDLLFAPTAERSIEGDHAQVWFCKGGP